MIYVDLSLLVRIYLTSTNVDNRSLGTKLLSEVLTGISPTCLNPDEGGITIIITYITVEVY